MLAKLLHVEPVLKVKTLGIVGAWGHYYV